MQKRNFKDYISLVLKGAGMGAANVIPGVSGGTIALITNIFEELIDSIKSFDLKAIKLLFTGKFKEFIKHTNLIFLIVVFGGALVSVFSLAVLLDYLFEFYPVYVWAFFFGLILASVYFVGRTIKRWSVFVIATFLVGTAIAILISVLSPASENSSFGYLILCGVIAICSMILPGLSGSFVLILLGNYKLVMIDAVNSLREGDLESLKIIIPVGIGAVVGLILFSHILSWVYKKFRDQTIALLTGFILGSLAILWPWKMPLYKYDGFGNILTKSNGEKVIAGYRSYLPDSFNREVVVAVLLVLAGILIIWAIEKYAGLLSENDE
ncbi:MAG: DUF368 domain-containing protein [Bacteroidales bacterium]|nr:DUF368 domain-containing protein [Bacteroidales bacterium]